MQYRCSLLSPLGPVTLAADKDGLTGLWFDGQKYYAASLAADAEENAALPVFALCRTWLDAYFAGARPSPAVLPLAPTGTIFQKRVWAELCTIPYGETRSYGALARVLHCGSARAVGQAVGRNPISLIIPCHRVIGSGGALTGYAGGPERKEYLLRLEGIL